MIDRAVIAALRNAIDVAMYVELAGVERCPNSILIRSLSLSAMGPVHAIALDLCWRHQHPLDTPASLVLQAVHDELVCQELETAI